MASMLQSSLRAGRRQAAVELVPGPTDGSDGHCRSRAARTPGPAEGVAGVHTPSAKRVHRLCERDCEVTCCITLMARFHAYRATLWRRLPTSLGAPGSPGFPATRSLDCMCCCCSEMQLQSPARLRITTGSAPGRERGRNAQ